MEQLYQATLAKWGEEAQYDQAVEECAELITALKHFRRGKVNQQAVIDELADVTLMLGQLTWMFGTEQVDEAVKNKLEKLNQLLDLPDQWQEEQDDGNYRRTTCSRFHPDRERW
ncbi:MAG: antitoxin [Desulfuromusa sp.]|nr:antitoxin [Desulfuromusa sp.]